MVSRPETKKARIKRHKRIRSKISGTAQCPRLCVFRSTNNIYAQLIDDVAGVTLAQASSLDKSIEGNGGNKEAAKAVGKLMHSVQLKRISLMLYLTEAVTFITAVLRNWPKALVRADSISKDRRNNFG